MKELEEYRKSIDNIDHAIISMLAERFKMTQKVGQLKAKEKLPAKDELRERVQLQKVELLAEQFDLNNEFAKRILSMIIEEVVKNHEKIAEENKY